MTEKLFYPYDVVKVKKKKDGKNNSKKNKREEDKNELYGTVARVWHHEFETLPIESLGILDQSGVGRALVKGEYGVEVLPIKERIIVDGSCLELLNREFDFGDLCKMGTVSNTGSSSVPEGMIGIVTNVETELELRHVITDELIGKKIPADKVRPAEYVSVGDFVLYKNWVGIVKDKFDEVLCETDEVKGLIRYGTSSSIGAFRYGYTERGGEESIDYGPAFGRFQHHPRFVEARQTVVYLDWLASNGKLTPQQSAQNPMPKAIFTELDQLIVLKHSLKQRYELDSQVIFASQSAAEEYNFKPSRHVQRSHFGTHKAQCDVMRVTAIHTTITVLWPDGRTSKHPSINLIPKVLDIGEIELWKGCHVLYTSIDEKDRGAIVESANLTERTAQVYLYNEEEQTKGKASTQNDPITVSTFEIKTTSSLKTGSGRTLRRGSVVMLVDSAQAYAPPITNVIGISSYADEEWGEHINRADLSAMAQIGGEMMSKKKQGELNVQKKPRTAADAHEIDWFGIVIDMQTDGTIIVQLPAGRKISVTMDKLSILINYSDDDDSDDDDLPYDEDDDDDDDSIMMDFLREADNVPWTTEDGSAVENANADEWEDDDEMDDDEDDDEVDIKSEKMTDVEDETLLDTKPTAAHTESKDDGQKSAVPVFEILEQAPTDHFFKKITPDSGSHSKKFLSHLRKEYEILQSSLPDTIFVKAYEDRADLLRVLIIGSKGTPYEDAPILIDFYLKPSYPLEPPRAHFHSWSDGHGRLSPNLYQEGMVCLSLLNTWTGEGSEKWHPNKSTLLQVFISIQALVLVAEPYFTEAGFELKERSDEVNTSSRQYSERAYVLARRSIWHAIKYPILGLEKDVKMIYDNEKLQEIKLKMQKLINDKKHDGLTRNNEANSSWSDSVTFSKGGQISLEKILMELEKVKVTSE
ncbi:hypothetical protein L7F22_039370 [Adiantum nelumboides]|nr:hypothetical protein [Adiantum nelumboides]